MNVLPFVVTILMLLAIMTYGKLYVFLTQNSIQSQYVCYMKVQEIAKINEIQQELFEKTEDEKPTPSKTEEGASNNHNPLKVDKKVKKEIDSQTASSRELNFTRFINADKRNQDPAQFQALYQVTKRLIEGLYQNQPFFQKIQEKRGNLVDQLLQTIMEKSALPENQGEITEMKYLANLDLGDDELQKVLIEMLKGSPPISKEMEKCNSGRKKEKMLQNQVEFPSLMAYLKINSTNNKKSTRESPLRLWLTSREVLQAIFNDDSFVNNIMETRYNLYLNLRKFKGNELAKQSALTSTQFKQLFENKIPQSFESFVDYKASSTKPPVPPSREKK